MPLTPKGQKIMSSMKDQYGSDKGERVFYASRNKGKIKGVDPESKPVKKFSKGGPVEPSEAPVAAANLLDTAVNPVSSTLGPWQALRRGGKAGWRRGL